MVNTQLPACWETPQEAVFQKRLYKNQDQMQESFNPAYHGSRGNKPRETEVFLSRSYEIKFYNDSKQEGSTEIIFSLIKNIILSNFPLLPTLIVL